ncbi:MULTISPECIES: YabP/YqfC family sporulation protein [Oscillospiraceae]|uniref:YabP/YqfC family sporulation protein n=1 Tax=Oscillospiraceae TaxID=216572 RepID=UPI000B37C603|nr:MULTISPECIES: YabP/YqfC family sporulation protein [Oscillospiraceae]MBM6724563.1 sporulation protein [Pseudoflavonifractor phocaeensis]MBM6887873.1 sporulation protein [Pseudoflavonifractor phocaeensis]OUO40707.1 sporulation protein [Flavonifractor sp. An306]
MEEYRRGLLERTAEALDLPGDVLAGLPHIELTGNRELRMENHKGILAYGEEEIRISGGKLEITVRGRGLELRAMNAGQLFITGTIQGVELC